MAHLEKINHFLLGLGLPKGEVIPRGVCNNKWQVLGARHTQYCFPGLQCKGWQLGWFLLDCCKRTHVTRHPVLRQRSW